MEKCTKEKRNKQAIFVYKRDILNYKTRVLVYSFKYAEMWGAWSVNRSFVVSPEDKIYNRRINLIGEFFEKLLKLNKLCFKIVLHEIEDMFKYLWYEHLTYSLTRFFPNAPFLYPLKSFLMFWGGRERVYWEKKG